jgi:hypothetical protein
MDQAKKNKILIVILILLIGISTVLHFSNESPELTTISNADKFAVADTAAIQKIIFTTKDGANVLERNNGGWTINNNMDADPDIVHVFLAVLKQLNISKGVAGNQMEQTKKDLLEKGIRVEIFDNTGLTKSFYVKGNSTKTLSVFMDEKERIPYVVELPGYDSYVAGIFSIPPIDWRRRLIFNSTWRSLRKLEMLYPAKSKNSFEIRFDVDFFTVTGVDDIDTISVMNYIETFQYFQADRYIEPKPRASYKKLLKTEPLAYLSIEDIDDRKNNRITFYNRLKGDRMIMGKLDNGELALFEYKRIRNIFKKKSDFENKKKK